VAQIKVKSANEIDSHTKAAEQFLPKRPNSRSADSTGMEGHLRGIMAISRVDRS